MALYLYGLMRSHEASQAADVARDGLPSLHTVDQDGLAALTSPMEDGAMALRRENALAHSDTLQAAFEHGPVLPVSFGTVLTDEQTLKRDFLAPRAEMLLRRLDALDGRAEMQVQATYPEESLLRSILASSPRLAEAAERIRKLPDAASHFDRIALGEAISGEVQVRREADSRRIIVGLRELALAVNLREPTHERGVLNAAFLVDTGRLEEFDAEVERLSDQHADEMRFKLIGPMPAYSFADQPWEDHIGTARSPSWG